LQAQGTMEGTLESPRVHVHDGALLRAKITMPDRKKSADAPMKVQAEPALSAA
jgi:hypothetical protein